MRSITPPELRPVRFAVNFSPALERLLASGAVEADLVKCPDWPELLVRARMWRPVCVHFPLFVGRRERARVDLNAVEKLFRETETPHVNVHLDAQVGRVDLRYLEWEEVLARTCREITALQARFGAGHVVMENVPYWTNRDLHARLTAEPWFISRIVEETGVGLLLDLAHARIAAASMGLQDRDYIRALPVRHVRELHVTGIGLRYGWVRDHLPLQAEDWALAEWACEQIQEGTWGRPRIVALEYGGVGERFEWRTDPAVLAEQAPRLYSLVSRLNTPVLVADAA